jgi:hypothetical protein
MAQHFYPAAGFYRNAFSPVEGIKKSFKVTFI